MGSANWEACGFLAIPLYSIPGVSDIQDLPFVERRGLQDACLGLAVEAGCFRREQFPLHAHDLMGSAMALVTMHRQLQCFYQERGR